MVKDLLVRISASMSGLKKGLDDAVKVTQTSANKIDSSSKQISDSLNNAFTGTYRNSISELNDLIQTNRDRLIAARAELQRLQAVLRGQKKGTQEFEATQKAVKKAKNAVQGYTRDVAELNVKLRDQKTNLANSRLAAEDNSSAMESLSRITTAVTGAVLLLGDGNEKLQPIMKGVRIAVAALNAVVAIQNLRLRENALLTGLSTKAQGLWTSVTVGTTKAMTVLKSTLTGLGIGALLVSLLYLTQNWEKVRKKISSVNRETQLINDTLEEFKKATDTSAQELAKFKTESSALLTVIKDSNSSLKQKNQAYKELTKIVPELNRYTLNQALNENKINDAIGKQIQLIQLRAKAIALQNTIVKEEERLIKEGEKKKAIEDLKNKGIPILQEYNEYLSKGGNLSFELWSAQKDAIRGTNTQQNYLNSLVDRYVELQKEILNITADQNKEDTKNKKIKIKSAEDILSSQEKLVLDEIKLQGDLNKSLKQTDEERLRSDFITQKRLLDVQEEFAKERLDASDKSITDLNSYYAQIAKINNERLINEQSYENGLNNLRDKAIAEQIKDEENRLLAIEEAKDGTLKVYERAFEKEKDVLAKQYNEGKIDYKTYQDGLNKIQLDSLNKRKELLEGFGEEITGIEQQIADLQAKIREEGGKELTKVQIKLIKDAAKAIRSAFNSLLTDIGQGLQESLMRAMQGTDEAAQISLEILKMRQKELEQIMNDARSSELEILQARQQYLQNQEQIAEQSKDNLTQTFDSMLMAIGDFLIKLGSGLVAAAVATKAFQDLLIANPVAALAAGAAAVALGTIVKATLTEGVAFANGGIVSGPTLGLVGEYPGASTNPEVIAPLDKLKNMLNIGGNGNDGYIAETRVSGRDLAIVLNRYNQDSKRG